MTQTTFTIIDHGTAKEAPARVDGETVTLSAEVLETALGWKLEPQGFCKDGLCVPVDEGGEVVTDAGIDLAKFAAAVDRPIVVEAGCHTAALGASAATRRRSLESLDAPDFTLPDINGKSHSLSQYRGKKVLLVAFASW